MLDDTVFSAELTLLEDRFGRAKLTTEAKVRYYEYLAQNLTTTEFQAAAREIFNRDQFWPSPQRFVDVVRGSVKQRAEIDWQAVLHLAQAGETDLSTLPPAAVAAMRAAGGWRAIAYAEGAYQLEQLRKRFLAVHETQGTQLDRPQLEAPVFQELEVVS